MIPILLITLVAEPPPVMASVSIPRTIGCNLPPPAPTKVKATAGNAQATVTWTAAKATSICPLIDNFVTSSPEGITVYVSGSATSATVTNLLNGTSYTFTVTAEDIAAPGPPSSPSNAVTPTGTNTVPTAPQSVSATGANAQATVTWQPPTSRGGAALLNYSVTSSPGNIKVNTPNGSTTTATVTGLTNGTSYTFTVTATNSVGTGPASSASNAVIPATVPSAPTGVNAVRGNAQATVSWTAPTSNGGNAITGYVVTPFIGSTAQTATTFNSTATTQVVTGLTNGTSYTFTVAAINAVGTGSASAASNAVTPATVPGAPTSVTATGGNAQATVSWAAPASNGGSAITGYVVTPYVGSTAQTATTFNSAATTQTVTGLTNGTAYTFKVAAINSVGTGAASAASASVTPATVPSAPTNVVATAANAQATVSWTAPTSNGGSAITSYTVTPYVGTTAGTPQSVGPTTTTTTVTGLTNGTTYTFQVVATNAVGSSAAGTSNAATTGTPPGAPTNVTATAGNGQATVTWAAPTSNGGNPITGYVVTPFVGSTAQTATTFNSTATTETVTALSNGTTYTFTVAAINAQGTGAASAQSNAVIPATVPGAPTNVSAIGGNAQATVSWTAPTSTGGSAITGYVVTPFIGSTAQTATTFNSTATTQTVTGLTNGMAYTFTVAAINSIGTGPASAQSAAVTPATVPSAPTNVSAMAGNGQATVAWTAPASNGGSAITSYTVTPYVGTTAQTPTTFNSTATTQTVTGLSNGTTYTFQVVATNSVGSGAAGTSNAITPATSPGAPSNVTATGGNAQATLSWIAPTSNGGSAITGYVVTPYISNVAQTATTFNSNATNEAVTGLTNGTTYTFTVAAINAAGTGPASSPSNTVTPATVPSAPTALTVTGGNGQATLSWTAPSSNGGSAITGYLVTPYIGTSAQSSITFNSTATTETVTGLANGTTYTFTVAATNGVGTGPASAQSASVTPATVPAAPNNVTATGGNAQAVVSWVAPATNGGSAITGYTITPFVGTTAGTPQTAAATATSATVTGLVNGTTYTIQVAATNSVGTGPAGTSNAVTPMTVPQAPGNVTATGGNAQATVTWTTPSNGGSAITGYTVTPFVGTTAGTPQTAAATATSATITGLVNGTTYTFQVVATNAVGNSAPGVSNYVTLATVPGAPTGVVASTGNAQSTVSWTAPSSNGGAAITGYTVTPFVGTTAGTPVTVSGTATSATVTGLTNGTTYTFQVFASNSQGSGLATTSNAVTMGLPSSPTNVTATAGANSAAVSWTASTISGSSPITGYVVSALIGSQPLNSIAVGSAASAATLNGLQGGVAYTFQVYAVNGQGNGPASTPSSSVTPTGSASTYASTVLGDSPSTYLRLSDPSGTIAADSSGHGNAGTYIGSVTLGRAGLIPSDSDPGVFFDGGSAYVSTPTSSALQGDSTRSVEIWFSGTNGNGQVIFDSGTDGVNGAAFRVGITQQGGLGNNPPANTPGLYVAFGNDDVYLPGLYLADGRTHQVVITLSGSSLTLFVDGRTPQGYLFTGTWNATLVSQPFTLPTTPNTASNPVWIGHGRNNLWSGSSYFNGTIDEVAIYPTALAATQVTNHEQAAQVILSAPVIGSVTAGSNQATVTWSDSSNPNAFAGFVITADAGSTPTVSKQVAPTATSATLTGLQGGVSYTIQVSLSNAFGTFSASSSPITPTGSTSTYASTVESTIPQPILYYRLDDTGSPNAADSSGNGQNGVYVGTVTSAAGALANDADPAATFGSGYVAYSGANIPTGNTARTIEVWVKTTSTAGNQQLIGWGDCSGFNNQFDVRYNGGGQIVVNVCSSRTNPYINLPYSLSNGQWHQLIITFDGSIIVVYVDGIRASSTTPGALNTTRTGVSIGNGFQGSMDELAVYPGALTASQAMAHFLASGNSQPAPPATVTATAGANSATVTWTASPTNPAPVLGYLVTAYSGTQAENSVATGPSATSTTITGLQGGMAYTFAVSAINNFGFGSSTSSAAVTPTAPAGSTYASIVIANGPSGNGPVLYYRASEASGSPYAADSSGNGGWANYGSGVTFGGAGALTNDPDPSLNGSFFFNTGNGLPTGNAPRSVELWLKTTSTSNMTLVNWGDYSNGGTAFTVQLTAGYRVWINLNNQTNPAINSPYNLANGQWHYVVMTWNGSVFTLYVDGTSAGTWSNAGLSTTASGLTVGVGNNGNAPFTGNLDEIAIYNRALSQSEVTAHFAASGNSQPAASDPGTVGATAGTNQATVSWDYCHVTPPSTTCAPLTNASPVTGFVVTAFSGSTEQETMVASASASSAVMSGLQGGVSYTFSVAAMNNFGIGPSTSSGAVTPPGFTTTYLSTILASTPLVYYRLDDTAATAADSSGHGLIGSYFGSYTQGVQGALTSDADPAVSNAGLQVNQITTFPFGNAARSIEIWFKTSSTATQVLASYGDQNAGGTLFQWQIASGGNQLILGSTTASWSFNAPYNVDNGQWHMADVTYDGTNLTMYVDNTSMGSQAAGFNTDLGAVFATSAFSGSLDELSIYGRALTATDVSNHWLAAGAGVPAAPTNVTATAGTNSAVVAWTPPTPRGSPITSYRVTPTMAGGKTLATLSVTASTTSITVPALPSGVSVTFSVVAVNKYGSGPAATSSAVTILGALPAPNLDRFQAVATGGNPARGIYYEGWVSNNTVPATSLNQWTVEGWIWAIGSTNTTTGNMGWGLLNTTTIKNPNGVFYNIPNPDTPEAGINFNIGDLHGLNKCCDVSFVWPHNGNVSFGTNGQFTPTNPTLTTLFGGSSPVYIALDYDGTNVRGYINGSLAFTVADNAAIPIDAWAGFMDQTELRSGAFDGFRVSNIARYTGSSFTVPNSDQPSDASTLVDYNFDNFPVGEQPSILLTPYGPWLPVSAGTWPDSSSNHNAASWIGVTFPWEVGWYADSPFLVQPFEMTPGIAPSELADECNGVNTGSGAYCQRLTDLTIPGRGPSLDMERTYNTSASSILGPFGYGWSSSYSSHLAISTSGDVTVYDPLGGSEFFQNQSGVYGTPSYVSQALVLSGGNYTLTDKRGLKLVFNSAGQLIQEIDRNGYTTKLTYSGQNLVTVTEPAGRTLTYAYGTNGLVSSVTDGTRTVTYGYDASLNLTSVTNVLGGVSAFSYDSSHRMLSAKDPDCNATSGCNGLVNVYDANGRVSQQTDPSGNIEKFAYSSVWPLFTTTVTDPNGNQTVYDYALNLPVDMVEASNTPLSAKSTYAYDPATMGVAAVTNPNSETTTSTFDSKGNILTTTDPLGHTTTYTYNSLSEVLTTRDPLGVVTTNTYDANGNLLTVSTPLTPSGPNSVTTFTYADTVHPGDITAKTDPSNRTTTFSYDIYGDRASSTDALGNQTTMAYDSIGRLTSTVSPLGNVSGANPAAYTSTLTYNAARQPLTLTDPVGHQSVKQYDNAGRLIRYSDANGNSTTYTYDLDGRETSSTDAFSTAQATTSRVSYDGVGNILKQTDGLNHTLASFTYDALNRESTSADGLNRTTSYAYDSANRLITGVDPLNHTTTYTYDSGGRLTNVSFSDGVTPSVTYTYDADGQILTMVDGTGTTTDVWDQLHRLTQQTDGAGHSVGYGYDLAGRITSIAYPDGNCGTSTLCVTRQYDPSGRPSSIQDWLTHTTTFTYDANSNLTGIAYPNGVTATWTYTRANQLAGINEVNSANATVLSLGYVLDNNNQVTSENNTSYAYDSLNQLSSGAGLGYTYDAAGRLTQSVNGPNTTNYTYDNADQLTSTTVVGGGTTNFTYDAVGRRTSNGSTNLTWDQRDQLLTFGSNASYTYNGAGLRVSKTVGAQTEGFVWDAADGLPELIQDGSTAYVCGPGGLPLEQISGGTVYYYHPDQLGSIRALTDSSGTVVAAYTYDPYGNISTQTGSVSNPFLFAGEYRDAESGLYYLRARYYDPSTAQFISRDPKLSVTWQPYSYVGDNPVNRSDPSGLDWWSDFWNRVSSAGSAITNAWHWFTNLVSSFLNNAGNFLNSVVAGAQSGAGNFVNWFHQHEKTFAFVFRVISTVCGLAGIGFALTGAGAPLAIAAEGCSIAFSLAAAAIDYDLLVRGDPSVTPWDVAWDLVGAIPDVGALTTWFRAARVFKLAKLAGKGRMGRSAAARVLWTAYHRWDDLNNVFEGVSDVGTAWDVLEVFRSIEIGDY